MLIAKSLRPAVWRHRAVAPVLFVILMHVAAAAQISTSVCSSSALACEFQALVQGAVITNDSSASTFLQVLSSWGNPGDPQAQNKVPALVLQPSGRLRQILDIMHCQRPTYPGQGLCAEVSTVMALAVLSEWKPPCIAKPVAYASLPVWLWLRVALKMHYIKHMAALT